jgi:nucleoid-associated protein YgaU
LALAFAWSRTWPDEMRSKHSAITKFVCEIRGQIRKMDGSTYTVERGDTLWGIAEEYYGNGSEWPRIARANGLPTRGDPIIRPGQELYIP